MNDRSDARFSDTVLVVCPNVTIRSRLGELDPRQGEASLYRTRDLVPERLMPDLAHGRVVITNWHVFEPEGMQIGGVSAKIAKIGAPRRLKETVTIGAKTTTGRGGRYMTSPSLSDRSPSEHLRLYQEENGATIRATSRKSRSKQRDM